MSNQAKTNLKHFAVGVLIAALGAGSYVIAAVVFSDFTSGTTISASEMNTKLNALKDAVNASAASVTCPANTPTRFTDKGDGTVCDSQTGLMWEKKLAANDVAGNCANATQANRNIRCVNNLYTWSALSPNPDGMLFTDFLTKINRGESVATSSSTVTQAGYTDWRIPNIVELVNILAPNPCGTSPCIDPVFGPTQASFYWSSSSLAGDPVFAWEVFFDNGGVGNNFKFNDFHARAVRGGR